MKAPTVIKFLQDKEQSDYRLNESGEQLSDLLDEYAESHTQSHTAALREENERLKHYLTRISNQMNKGISSNICASIAKEALVGISNSGIYLDDREREEIYDILCASAAHVRYYSDQDKELHSLIQSLIKKFKP